MVEIEINDVKKIELDILLYFDEYCKANNLQFWLAYGTLIGAIRHKGFIPWDDDIDVLMPREDYNKLLSITDFDNNGRYSIISPYSCESKYPYIKIVDNSTVKYEEGLQYEVPIGIDIDVFPIDGSPDNLDEWNQIFEKKMDLFRKWNIITLASNAGSIKGRLYRFFKKIQYKLEGTTKDSIFNSLYKIDMQYDYGSSKYVASVGCLYDKACQRYEKSNFDETVLVNFEGREFPAPIGYDSVLRTIYGDYMELPPEEDRITHHRYKAFFKE